MVPEVRKKYNSDFTQEKYEAFLQELSGTHPGQLDFRVAETPLFIPKEFTEKVLEACEAIIDTITSPEYRARSSAALPARLAVPNEDEHPHFMAFDFGICETKGGALEPRLIELQGFPSLFGYQVLFPEVHGRHLWQPEGYSPYLNGFTRETYLDLLSKIIIGREHPENVVLLEIFPERQKTRIDFHCTQTYLGIQTVCLTEIIQEGQKLYYQKDGKKREIRRIYNRLIFDDLQQQPLEVQEKGGLFQQDLDVKWVPHPNWFYKISKFSLPFINHPFVPPTRFLSEVTSLPEDLENYVAKPLFSFAGQGVIIDVTREQLELIKDPHNWILQRKVHYAPIVQTLDEPAKAELRIFYFWEEGAPRPVATNNLARLSKGKMVGVNYNKDKSWVGGSFGLFEK